MEKTTELLQQGVVSLSESIKELTSEVSVLSERKTSLEKQVSDLEKDLSTKMVDLEGKITSLEKEVTSKTRESGNLSTEIVDKTKIIEALSKSSELITVERNKIIEPMAGLKSDVLEVNANIKPFVTEVKDLALQIKNIVSEIVDIKDKTSSDAERRLSEISVKEVNLNNMVADVTEREKKVSRLINKITD